MSMQYSACLVQTMGAFDTVEKKFKGTASGRVAILSGLRCKENEPPLQVFLI